MAGKTEREWTAWLAELFPRPRSVLVGIGDDAAVVAERRGASVITTDPVIEGVHFDAGTPPSAVAAKAVNRNLADLAAMGARPHHLVASVLLPRRMPAARVRALFIGLRNAAVRADCAVVGGDVGATPGPLTLAITAVGHLGGAALRRSNARAGDALHVTGDLGGAALGHHLRFTPPVSEGVWLAERTDVRAAIDVSDGLLLDLATLLAASGGLGAELDREAVPISAAARRRSRRSGRTPLEHAMKDGEDHVLLFAVPRGGRLPRGGPLRPAARQPIGRVTRAPGLWLVDREGTRVRLAAAGYQHEVGGGR